MNRTEYYNYIDKQLHILAERITTNGKLNRLHLHLDSENFYLHLFNLLYDKNLKNLNDISQNVEAIDLIDHDNKIMIQVSSTSTKPKIESALSKEKLKEYQDYRFKFISIAKDATNLRDKTYKNPHSIKFDPLEDIYDIRSFLNTILSLDIDKFKAVHEFILKELGEENINQNTINGDITGVGIVIGGTVNQNITICNTDGRKLITKEEIEAQREKEKNSLFSFKEKKSSKIYINREIDNILSNRINQKKGCVLFLHGQGGIGKSTLLDKFSRRDRPTIFIHLKNKIDVNVLDIFLDRDKSTISNCLKLQSKLGEISIKKENDEKLSFNLEYELLEALQDDFSQHGIFIIDTFEKNKNSNIQSNIDFNMKKPESVTSFIPYRFRDYLESLISLFISKTTFIIAGRNRIDDVIQDKNEDKYIDFDGVEEIELYNFSIEEIKNYIFESKLDIPKEEQLSWIEELTKGNPLLIYLFIKIVKEYTNWNELDYDEMKKIVAEDSKYGLLYYFTERILSHIDIKDIWKLVIPRILTKEIEKKLFKKQEPFNALVDIGLAHKGKGKERNIYTLHDNVAMAIESYAKKELDSLKLSSWHDHKKVVRIHKKLMEFYQKNEDINGLNSAFEGCYHKMMLREGFEREFDIPRGEFVGFILGTLILGLDKKISICKNWNKLENSEIVKYIKDLKNEKDRANISNKLYDRLSKDLASGIVDSLEDIDYLIKLSKSDEFKKDWSIFWILGIAYKNKKEYDKSIEAYQKGLEINIQGEELHNSMGVTYKNKKEYDKAIKMYQKAIYINPKKDEVYYNMGILYSERGEYSKAISEYLKAVNINPQRYEVYYNIGIIYEKKREYDIVIEMYKKALEINPKYDDAYNNMGIAYAKKGEYDKAIEAYKKAVEINSQRDDAYNNIGIAFGDKKDYNRAIKEYQKAVEINPQRDDVYYNIGITYYWLEKFDKAIKALSMALSINPNNSSANKLLIEVQLKLNT